MSSPRFLRYVLWADAVSCLACGVLQVALSGSLSTLFGLSQMLLFGTGVFLLLYGAAVGALAMRSRIPNAIVWFLIAGNILWGVLAADVLFREDVQLTLLGKGYVVAQALTVMILAELQYWCVRSKKDVRFDSAGSRSRP